MLVSLLVTAASGATPIGTWTAGPRLDEMREDVRDQVETYVADVGPMRRRIVRWALNRATAPCSRILIEDHQTALAIRCDDQKTAVAPADGSEVTFTGDDGRTLQLAHRLEDDGTIVQSFAGKHGSRINRFQARQEGGVTVDVTIRSPQLDAPLEYSLRYE